MSRYEKKILGIINASNSHMTSEEVFLALKAEEPKVVLATVYNNLKKLTEDGKITKLSLDSQPDRYDRVYKHDHLICSLCGGISDYRFSDLTENLEKELGSVIEGYDLRIRYICPACRKKESKENLQ